MAKGNDGNYLQHSVEVAVATSLAAEHPEGRLHVALAHGMAPFERCGELPNGQTRRLLQEALRAAQRAPAPEGSPIVEAYRVTNASAALNVPWLCMDPMTYREDGDADDNNLYRADLARVAGAISSFAASGRPGVAALFVYAVKPEVQPQFWAFVDVLARQTDTTVESCWLTHQGGNRNLAALLCSAFVLPSAWLPGGLNPGR